MNIIINFDEVTGKNRQEQNTDWLQIQDHPYRILIVGDSVSGKTNALLNLIHYEENDNFIGKIFLYDKDPYKPMYEYSMKRWKEVGQ